MFNIIIIVYLHIKYLYIAADSHVVKLIFVVPMLYFYAIVLLVNELAIRQYVMINFKHRYSLIFVFPNHINKYWYFLSLTTFVYAPFGDIYTSYWSIEIL